MSVEAEFMITTNLTRNVTPSIVINQTMMACVYLFLVGCGSNQFQQELQIEQAAVKLAKETIQGQYPLITTDELRALIESKRDFLLVDAMPAASSYSRAHIQGAVNFEFPKEVIPKWNEVTMPGRSREDYAALLGEDKQRLIVVYCGFVKCARSHNAAVFAHQLGYTNVKRYPGGIYAWQGAGNPVVSQP